MVELRLIDERFKYFCDLSNVLMSSENIGKLAQKFHDCKYLKGSQNT